MGTLPQRRRQKDRKHWAHDRRPQSGNVRGRARTLWGCANPGQVVSELS